MTVALRLRPPVLWTALLGVALVFAGCRQSVPTFEEQPAASEPTAAPAPAPATNAAPSRAEQAVWQSFHAYESSLRGGDLVAARRHRRAVDDALPQAGRAGFWEAALAPATALELVLLRVCPECASGACSLCGGSAACVACEGSGACPECAGKGGFTKTCKACVCTSCRGTARCAVCRGTRTQACAPCSGTGRQQQREVRVPCRACGGKGQRRGLAKRDGTAEMLPCLTCKGRGYTSLTLRPECPACHGSGQVACAACGGNGTCPACRGTGRQATCAVCGTKGTYTVACQACKGSAECAHCAGTGICPACEGRGVCRLCGGASLVTAERLPIAPAWTTLSSGYAVCGATSLWFAAAAPPHERIATNIGPRSVWFDVPSNGVVWVTADGSWAGASSLLCPTNPPPPAPSQDVEKTDEP